MVLTALDPLNDKPDNVELDDTVLRSGESLVAHIGGTLHLFHAYHTLPTSVIFDDSLMLNYEDLRAQLADQNRHAMAQLINERGLSQAEPSLHLAQGEVHKELPKYARDVGADIVVMGGVDRDTTERLLSGSTTENVLDHLEADVLVVRPD